MKPIKTKLKSKHNIKFEKKLISLEKQLEIIELFGKMKPDSNFDYKAQ